MEGTMEQFTEKLAGLVELGKKNKNFLEYAQIDSYFKDMKLNSDMMEAIYDYLEQNGIDVLTLAAVADDDEDLDDPIEDETEIAVPDGVSIEDPVRMYLKEIGKVPLLSADEEIEYAKRMEKGNEEAQRLIANAQEEAKKIIEDARKEAESIVNSSRKSADELAENTKSELKLFAGQAVNALKSEIATMVTDKLITASVKDFAQDKDYLNAFIVALASKWSIDEPIVISTADAESLKKYFAAHAKALLDKGVTIQQVNGIKTLFTVSPADGSYKVNFGEEEFMNYFKAFLRPQLVEMLF